MTVRERTLQQRDPLAALVGRPTTYLAGLGIPVFAVVLTAVNRDSIENVPFAVLAILLVIGASTVLVSASSPLRAPLRAATLGWVVGLALAAFVASALSMGTQDSYLRDDWGPPVVGLYLLALAPYRPAKQLATAGALSAILAGFVAVTQSAGFTTAVPTMAFIVVAVTPIIAMSLAAAAFADVLVRSLDNWRQRSHTAFSAMSNERGEWIARSVQQDRVTVLNQEVVPFFSELLDGGSVTESTRERARDISRVVRDVMVAEVDRTWLDAVAPLAVPPHGGSAPTRATVSDEKRLAVYMSTDERTALRALLVMLHGSRSFEHGGVDVRIDGEDARCLVRLTARLSADENRARADLAPFLAVMRVVFTDLRIEHTPAEVTVRFSYEQR